MTDLEIIEAGVAAAYSGDAERALELFELPGLDDDHIRRMEFEAAIGGRVNLDCKEQETPGLFTCNWSYQNALSDAIGVVPASEDSSRVVVDEGVVTEFENFMTGPTWLRVAVGHFLNERSENGLITPEVVGADTECYWAAEVECAEFMVDHLDEWVTWAEANLPIEGFELP